MENTKKALGHIIEKIAEDKHDYDEGDCGDLVATLLEIIPGKAIGVQAHDGEIVHAVLEYDGCLYDGKGEREEEELREEWAFNYSPEYVNFVELTKVDDIWTYEGKEVMSSEIFHLSERVGV